MLRTFTLALVAASFAVPAYSQETPTPPEGWTAIFDGKSLEGWKPTGSPKAWGVEKGLLFTDGGNGGWLMTDKEYKNFEIKLDYKPSKESNSGVALRSPLPKDMAKEMPDWKKGWDPAYVGMEIQLIDDANWKGLQPWQHTGSVYNVIPAAKVNPNPIGEWNAIHITANGSKVKVVHNGEVLVDGDLKDCVKEHSARHPGILREGGHLGLQSHGHRTEFKNIYVKTLD
jgi:Domain of Unknown Function (DUF1080)